MSSNNERFQMKKVLIYIGLFLLTFLIGYNLAIIKAVSSLTMKVQFEPIASDSLQHIKIQDARSKLRKSRPEIESWFVSNIQEVDSGTLVTFSGSCGEKSATISGGFLAMNIEYSQIESSLCSPIIAQFIPKAK